MSAHTTNPNHLQQLCVRLSGCDQPPICPCTQACPASPAALAKQSLGSARPPGTPQSRKLQSRSTISSSCSSWPRNRLTWQCDSPSSGAGGHSKHATMIAGKARSRARAGLQTTIRQHTEQRSKEEMAARAWIRWAQACLRRRCAAGARPPSPAHHLLLPKNLLHVLFIRCGVSHCFGARLSGASAVAGVVSWHAWGPQSLPAYRPTTVCSRAGWMVET